MYIILDILIASKSFICFKCKCVIYPKHRYFHKVKILWILYMWYLMLAWWSYLWINCILSLFENFHYAKILTNGNDMCNDMCNEPILIPFTGGFTRCTNCHTSSWLSFTMSNSRNRLVTTFIAGLKTKFNTTSSTGSYFICICFNNYN